jgi:hypothetical protein
MRLTLSVLILLFTGLIIWAMGEKPIGESADFFFSDPWGIVSLIDLYIGFFIFIIFVAKTSTSKIYTLLWSIGLLVLGNVVSLIYLVCFISGIGVKKGQLSEL